MWKRRRAAGSAACTRCVCVCVCARARARVCVVCVCVWCECARAPSSAIKGQGGAARNVGNHADVHAGGPAGNRIRAVEGRAPTWRPEPAYSPCAGGPAGMRDSARPRSRRRAPAACKRRPPVPCGRGRLGRARRRPRARTEGRRFPPVSNAGKMKAGALLCRPELSTCLYTLRRCCGEGAGRGCGG